MLFIADDNDWDEMKRARQLTQMLNTVDRCDFEKINALVTDLFGRADESTFLNPPFYCDYGSNIFVGKNCFINYNCTILDNGRVTLRNNVWVGGNTVILPGVHIGDSFFIC